MQTDNAFEKQKIRNSKKIGQRVFNLMEGGKKIYPREGLEYAGFLIDQIRRPTTFSTIAFDYALYHSHMFRPQDAEKVLLK